MIRTFALNSTWPGYPRALMDPGLFVTLVVITLAVELAAFYAWFHTEKRIWPMILIIICGNVASALFGFLLVAVWP